MADGSFSSMASVLVRSGKMLSIDARVAQSETASREDAAVRVYASESVSLGVGEGGGVVG